MPLLLVGFLLLQGVVVLGKWIGDGVWRRDERAACPLAATVLLPVVTWVARVLDTTYNALVPQYVVLDARQGMCKGYRKKKAREKISKFWV